MTTTSRTIVRMEKTTRTQRKQSEEARRKDRLRETALDTLDRLKTRLSLGGLTSAKRDEILVSMGAARSLLQSLGERGK